MNPLVCVENLSFAYNKETIIKDMSFNVEHGQFLAIVGPNGAGKTTLLNLICGILKPALGKIKVDSILLQNYSTKTLAQKIAVVRQQFTPAFDFTVTEVVSMARTPYLSILGFESGQDNDIVSEALKTTDTLHLADRPISQISSGERQRVFIARALAQNTPIILLDEPTSFLDLRHQVKIYDLLKHAQFEKAKTIIAISHDLNLTLQYCQQTLLLFPDKTFRFGKTSDVLTKQQIEKAFGVNIAETMLNNRKIVVPIGKSFGSDK